MKVNQKILSIPPYISTSWKNVTSLHLNRSGDLSILIIGLLNGSTIEIPNLDLSEIEMIFNAHQKHIEQEEPQTLSPENDPHPPAMFPGINLEGSSTLLSLPLRFGNNAGDLLQHNPEAADSPNLPKEVLEKIALLSKSIGFDSPDGFPKAEPHCNCMHCQIMRIIHQDQGSDDSETENQPEEEEVSDLDLKFREWDIKQTNEKLFIVSNPLNTSEQYNVFLGNPVGCTCGTLNCEHIRAVLNS